MSANVRSIGSHRCIAVLKRIKGKKISAPDFAAFFCIPVESIGGAGGRSLCAGSLGFRGLLFSSEQSSGGGEGVVCDGIVGIDWMW